MHAYTANVKRWKVTAGIALLAFILGRIVNELLRAHIPGLIRGISPFALFTVLWFAFDRWLWNAVLIRRIVPIPDLNGTWTGEVRSSFTDDDGVDDADDLRSTEESELNIKQTWSKIEIQYRNPGSSVSESTSASMRVDGNDPVLTYTYENTPEGDGLASKQQKHEGTAQVRVAELNNKRRLRGRYYTDEERHNHGTLEFAQRR
jgi:hypothetical protein